MSRIDEAIQAKKEKRAALEAQGVLAHPYSFNKQHTVSQARESEGTEVKTAGRVVAVRTHGKVTFWDLQDSTTHIQVMIREGELSSDQELWVSLVDRGDFIGVEGTVITTQTGELTIQAKSITFLGKALRPLPSQWNAAEDKEARFRKRYLDMLINPETKRVLDARWLIEKEIRRYLQDAHSFTEVETPVFQPLYGGTNATPFTTYMNALDSTFYLRLAPELYLKRLIVGGYDKVFEIARNFRNEGIDQTHQPEFTMIEWYETYADYNRMMDVAEGLFQHLAVKLYGNTTVQVGEQAIDIGDNWPRITMKDALKEHTDIDFDASDDQELQDLLTKHNLDLTGEFSRGKALFELFDKLAAEKLVGPLWIIDYPRDISPLAKAHRSQQGFAERFEAYIGGKELADGWSEITDAIDQRNIFENEQTRMRAGDTEAHPLDEDFLEAMEYGMPPLGGIGIGIDRLVMFLTNTWAIKEVIAFPTLRPLPWQQPGLQQTKTISPSLNSGGISPLVRERFPGIFYAQIKISNVSIQKTSPELEEFKQIILQERGSLVVEDISSLTPISEYRKIFKATGVDFHSKRPSPEALLRRVAQGKGLYTINTAVDAYNLTVIQTAVGLGGFDADQLSLPVTLRFSVTGERMLLLGDDKPTFTTDGQLVYADQDKPITINLNYRDIDETKISTKTTNVMLYADGAPGLSQEEALMALQQGAAYIQRFCGGEISKIEVFE